MGSRFTFKRFCDRCGILFRPKCSCGRFCKDCLKIRFKERMERYYAKWNIKECLVGN